MKPLFMFLGISLLLLQPVLGQDTEETLDLPIDVLVLSSELIHSQPGFRVSFLGNVTLPHHGYRIENIEHTISNNSLLFTFSISMDETNLFPQTEIEHFFHHSFFTEINLGEDIKNNTQIRFLLINSIKNNELIPNPEALKPIIEIYPKPVKVNDTIRISISGEFPNAAYRIVHKSISVVDQTISISTVIDPDETGATVITPFAEHFWVNPLAEGEFTIQWLVNGEIIHTQPLHIALEPNPFEDSPFHTRLRVPPILRENVRFDVIAEGISPQANVLFRQSSGNPGLQNYVRNITMNANSRITEPFVNTPFKGTALQMSIGSGEWYIRSTLNGDFVPPLRLVGENTPVYPNLVDDHILLRREIFRKKESQLREESFLRIDSEGKYVLLNEHIDPGSLQTGTIPPTLLSTLNQLFEDSNFNQEPWFITQHPLLDIPEYLLVYKNQAVLINGIERASKPIQDIVQTLNSFLSRTLQTSSIDKEVWKQY